MTGREGGRHQASVKKAGPPTFHNLSFCEPPGADVREVEATCEVRAAVLVARGRAGRALPRARHPASQGRRARPQRCRCSKPGPAGPRFFHRLASASWR
jgi:hypothetical protein